jgi:hypothetical protein
MRFNPEIPQARSVAKQFRQKNEKARPEKWGMDWWITGLMNWRWYYPIYPAIQ